MNGKISVILSSAPSALRVTEKLKRAVAACRGKEIFVLVPDQYTVAAERFYLNALGEKTMASVRVISFKRLATIIFDRYRPVWSFVGAGGKRALLYKAYNQVSPTFRFFKPKAGGKLLDTLCDTISELKTYRISPDGLFDRDSDKLNDIASVYGAYDALLGAKRADPDDTLSLAAQTVREHGIFADQYFFIDFFKVLNASELEFVYALYDCGADVTITLMTDSAAPSLEPCEPVAAVYRRIQRYVSEGGGALVTETAEKAADCAYDRGVTSVMRAADASDELDFIACEITRLVRDCGCCYDDIAIVCRDTESYAAYIDTVFGEYGIPVFFHKKSLLKTKMPAKFLFSLLDNAVFGFDKDRVCDMADCGMMPFTPEQISDFKMYISVWNIRYGSFKKPFDKSVRGFSAAEEDSESEKSSRDNAEYVRNMIVGTVEDFKTALRDKTVREAAEEIWQLYVNFDIETRLGQATALYTEHDRAALAAENTKVFGLIVQALDELVDTVGDDKLSLSELSELLNSLFSAYSIGILPPSVDTVLAGNADTVPLLGQKYVFMFGLADGVFPSSGTSKKLIGSADREKLRENDILLGQTDTDRYLYELFIADFVMKSATEGLYMTYPAVGGGERAPSEVFSTASKRFGITERPLEHRIQTEKQAFTVYVRRHVGELKQRFAGKIDTVPWEALALDKNTAEALFGRSIRLSATKVSSYYECAYKYFCRYGLNVDTVQKASLNPSNIGTILHEILERTLSDEDITVLSDEQLAERAVKYSDLYLKHIFGAGEVSQSLLAYFKNLTRKASRILVMFRQELAQSEFRPQAFELRINDSEKVKPVVITIPDGSVRMTGTIDRLDLFEKDGKKYYRIIDYKSGKKKFALEKVLNGVDIQMMMYLCAVVASEPEAVPAGVLYANINPVTVTVDYGSNVAAAEKKLAEQRARSGIFLDDKTVLHAMDKELCGKYIPVEEDKNNDNCISEEEFAEIFGKTELLLANMGRTLLCGEISKNPVHIGDVDACKYCVMKNNCSSAGKYADKACSANNGKTETEVTINDSDGRAEQCSK